MNNPYRMNITLAKQRGLSDEEITAIQMVGNELVRVCLRPLHYGNYRDVVEIVNSLETTLQMMWGFSYSKKFHYFQNEIKGCLCPKLDNQERVGHTTTRFINENCPYHGITGDDE